MNVNPTVRRAKLLFLLSTLQLAFGCLPDPCHEERQHFKDSVRVGKSEGHVRLGLGDPTYDYTQANAPTDFYVHGYTHPDRAISGRLLIYVASESICYVYLDKSGNVEYVFVGGS